MNKLFIFQNAKNRDYEHELNCAYDKYKKNSHKANLSSLKIDSLIKDSIGVVISSGLPKEWYFIFKGLNIVAITLGEIDTYFNLADIVIDHKSLNNNRYFTGLNYSICNNPEMEFKEIVDLITKLDWDSKFWGFPVAYLSCKHLTENIVHRIDKIIKRDKLRLVEYLCNCHDNRSVEVAERYGFHFTDIRLTFEKILNKDFIYELPNDLIFSRAKEKDIKRLKQICSDLYKDSRYFFDVNFSKNRVKDFYQCWIERAVLGKFDDECFCLYKKNFPIGFCSIKYNLTSGVANIGLFGMDPAYQGKGLGKVLLNMVLSTLFKKNINKIHVVTQGRNYAAQRLYQSLGFLTKATELWYHKWF